MRVTIKDLLFVVGDIIFMISTYILASLIRFEGVWNEEYIRVLTENMAILILIKVCIYFVFGLYRSVWKYASVEELMKVVLAVIVANLLTFTYIGFIHEAFPRSVYFLVAMFDVFFVGGVRFAYRAIRVLRRMFEKPKGKRVLVIGAGQAGFLISQEIKYHQKGEYDLVGFLDDDIKKIACKINGAEVLGSVDRVRTIARLKQVEEIIIAMPSISRQSRADIIRECEETRCKLRILPGVYELINGSISIKQIRDVEIEDLLGREKIELDTSQISEYIEGKRIIVTGGGGSIGSELCRQIAKYSPKQLVILDIYENNAYDLQNEIKKRIADKNLDIDLQVVIASIRDENRINSLFKIYKPEIVFHAAAHKHVPLMEDSPLEAIKNNVFGTRNLAKASVKHGVEKFVMISTDKAVNPTNIMGATKRLCEMIVQSYNDACITEFVAVRFGNVLGSNGSVIPLFKKQILEGGPVTVTHEDIIRYFMTIPEAAQLVMQAGGMAKGGEIFVLDMGEPVRIVDLARQLIKLSGLEPDVDILIKITGLRDGEKLYEELLLDDEGIIETKNKKIYIGKQTKFDLKYIEDAFNKLHSICKNEKVDMAKLYLQEIVPTYKPNKSEEVIQGKAG